MPAITKHRLQIAAALALSYMAGILTGSLLRGSPAPTTSGTIVRVYEIGVRPGVGDKGVAEFGIGKNTFWFASEREAIEAANGMMDSLLRRTGRMP